MNAEKIQLHFGDMPAASTPPDGVDLWLLDLSRFADNTHTEFSALVSPDELVRASQFKRNSIHFLATRALLRAALAHYTGLHAQALLFARGEHGKPFLHNAAIHFNLSHCNDLAVLAVCAHGEVGVDIESMGERDYLNIAKRYFHPHELHALQACELAERERLFYKLWTLKEAFFKATGGGIASGLDKVFFNFENSAIKASFNPALNLQENAWQFHQEFIATDTLVALVSQATQTIQHQWLNGNALLSGT
jgi:4'-phosphopantetheinyl transferase